MDNTLLKGIWKYLLPVPPFMWQKAINKMAGKARARIRFMTPDHHAVRNFVVLELPRSGVPLSPQRIASELGFSIEHVFRILDDLETAKFFLFRNNAGEVVWAYPVTVQKTPHKAIFSSGEEIFAA